MKYWNNTGKFEAEAAQLLLLVPGAGKAATFKGEVWRAACKIYYDYFNNGWGNEWRAPAEFLMDSIDLPARVEIALEMHAEGNVARGNFEYEMDLMIDTVILRLRDIEDRANTIDMWDYRSTTDRRFEPNEYEYDTYDNEY